MDRQDQVYEIRTENWAYGGEVMGRLPDGRAVFVPFALPGELVRIKLVEEKRGYARASLLDVIEQEMGEIEGHRKDPEFLKLCDRIQGKVVEIVFTHGDAFEAEDNNYWLPECCWEPAFGGNDGKPFGLPTNAA